MLVKAVAWWPLQKMSFEWYGKCSNASDAAATFVIHANS